MRYDPIDFELPTIIKKPKLNEKTFHGLVQEGTGRLMALSIYMQTVSTLSQMSGYSIPRINRNSFGRTHLSTEDSILNGKVWDWRYNPNTQKFEYDPDIENVENNYCIRLVAEKAALLDLVNAFITALRRPKNADVLSQTEIQIIKEQQARVYLSANINWLHISENNYVKQYADIYDISLEESAKRIIIQADSLQRALFNSEGLRLRYYKAIKECKSIAEVLALKKDFSAERYEPAIFRDAD